MLCGTLLTLHKSPCSTLSLPTTPDFWCRFLNHLCSYSIDHLKAISGLEAFEATQLIDACIGIVNTITSIGRAVNNAQGLPPKLKDLFEKIPAIEELLENAHESFQHGKVGPDASRTA